MHHRVYAICALLFPRHRCVPPWRVQFSCLLNDWCVLICCLLYTSQHVRCSIACLNLLVAVHVVFVQVYQLMFECWVHILVGRCQGSVVSTFRPMFKGNGFSCSQQLYTLVLMCANDLSYQRCNIKHSSTVDPDLFTDVQIEWLIPGFDCQTQTATS